MEGGFETGKITLARMRENETEKARERGKRERASERASKRGNKGERDRLKKSGIALAVSSVVGSGRAETKRVAKNWCKRARMS